ncbi:MAG: hypothetical protein JZD41_06815 [Thermoproteus sp.]|nr:hypothetical protein [Thermoproteus sp.]
MDKIKAEILAALAAGDAARAKALLAEIHRAKAFHIGDYYVGIEGALEAVARLHAYHIALAALAAPPAGEGGVTGRDSELATKFSRALSACSRIAPPEGGGELDEFYRKVTNELNSLVESLCSRS